jgi:hypothetical protein
MKNKLNCFSYFQSTARNYKAPQIIEQSIILRSFLLIAVLSGCAPPSIESTRVGREMRNSQAEGASEILRDAVFSMTRGKSTGEAVSLLESDGAICTVATCSWMFTRAESMWDRMGVRPAGPLRRWSLTYRIEFSSPTVSKKSDIAATVISKELN